MEDNGTNSLLIRATEVVCRQGMIPFPLSDAAVKIEQARRIMASPGRCGKARTGQGGRILATQARCFLI